MNWHWHDDRNIKGFRGEYSFLSNMHRVLIEYDGRTYPSSENAYQAMKVDDQFRDLFTQITPYESKDKWKCFKPKYSAKKWDSLKFTFMSEILRIKFSDPELRQLLINTGDRYIEETNTWGDIFWGVCNEVGENNLGLILMEIRNEINLDRSKVQM